MTLGAVLHWHTVNLDEQAVTIVGLIVLAVVLATVLRSTMARRSGDMPTGGYPIAFVGLGRNFGHKMAELFISPTEIVVTSLLMAKPIVFPRHEVGVIETSRAFTLGSAVRFDFEFRGRRIYFVSSSPDQILDSLAREGYFVVNAT